MPKMHIEYNCTDSDHHYVKALVERLMLNEFPGAVVTDGENLVDKLAEIFMGTRNTRLAGLPNPESQVKIRAVIRQAIERHRPIPILVGSGPKKNKGGQIDLAELSAMRLLACIQKSAQEYYEPGFNFRIRLEDATGIFLEGDTALEPMATYCVDFKRLCEILNRRISPSQFLVPYLESSSCNSLDEFIGTAESYVPAFAHAYRNYDDVQIEKLGWKGGFSDEWRGFLNDRYSKLYPQLSNDERVNMAARYLASTLAKVNLKMRGNHDVPDWSINGDHLEISFAPSPGTSAVSSRAYYRTMSAKQTKLHVPYWRGKGYFRLIDSELKLGLARSTDTDNIYIPGHITIDDGRGEPLKVQADLLENVLQ